MNKKQIVHIVLAVIVIVVVLLVVQLSNLGPALTKAFITLHGGR